MSTQFDFRMDRMSWLMIVAMIGVFMYFVVPWGFSGVGVKDYTFAFLIALVVLVVLLGLVSIPVLIICYFIKRIPDIDYSVWGAFGITILGLISEFI